MSAEEGALVGALLVIISIAMSDCCLKDGHASLGRDRSTTVQLLEQCTHTL
jgi:hypothetical protein